MLRKFYSPLRQTGSIIDDGLQRADDNVDELRSRLADLQAEAQQAVTALERSFDNKAEALEQLPITAKSSDSRPTLLGWPGHRI